jgi:peptidoglycan hydrolase-like protein with peptidoglycan-binding domain
MFTSSRIHFTAAFIALGTLFPPQVAAGPYDGQRMVLVTTEGQLMREVPEYGSVRIVIDTQGRRLVLDRWDTVIGFEIPAWQYHQQRGIRDRGFDREFDHDRGFDREFNRDIFPAAPRPQRDRFANADPLSRIERRDLNPMTGTVPEPDDQPEIIQAPSPDTPAAAAPEPKTAKLSKAQVAALQVYLDRNGISPGVIDGRMGSNVRKALDSWQEVSGERIDPADTDLILSRLAAGGGLAFTTYTITAEDAAGPFIASVPSDYADKARLDRLAYTSTLEMLAERFHMDERYLEELNPGVDFSRPGVQIKVVDTGAKKSGTVTRIIADKGRKQVRAYDASGKLVAAYPATIGSASTPLSFRRRHH